MWTQRPETLPWGRFSPEGPQRLEKIQQMIFNEGRAAAPERPKGTGQQRMVSPSYLNDNNTYAYSFCSISAYCSRVIRVFRGLLPSDILMIFRFSISSISRPARA